MTRRGPSPAAAGAAIPSGRQEKGALVTPGRDVDEEVVARHERGDSYASVASAVGLKRATDAHAAFVRVMRRRPDAERAALAQRESARLDQLEQRNP